MLERAGRGQSAHTQGFVLDERSIEVGIAWYVSTVLTAAEELQRGERAR